MFVKEYVVLLEDAAIAALAELGVPGACRKPGAPGVYVPMPEGDPAKIAALGIKIRHGRAYRSEEHTSELQSLMRISSAVFCLKKKKHIKQQIAKQIHYITREHR